MWGSVHKYVYMFTDLALERGADGGDASTTRVCFVYENSASRHMINIHQRRVEISRDISITKENDAHYMLYFHYFMTFHYD